MRRLFPDRCDHPGFVSQTYRVRADAVNVIPDAIGPVRPGTYWTEPRCVACGAPERPLTAATGRTGTGAGWLVAAAVWAILLALWVVRALG